MKVKDGSNPPTVFELKRLSRFLLEHRNKTGALAQLKDIEKAGFSKQHLKAAVKKKLVLELYTDMTSRSVVKVYKPAD